ncbi:MAG: excinuclease ABC subunit UvrC [Alphaproteobacteria bacterium]|nr:MAG: excinuclease ABC subunit UvrC [Alphaproteobacteria bacterium]TAF16142.1 MAG: excinuclease ABC subunit UvrC [Alphaproteobacteria bacterium]TAF41225.1 MAG: excinuclease ABC subunit UvrC [Alphaproteobacteria bacterium]TAF75104.1 MAG: excinuclease ABC subunit UvrC [Alphaproteobacteria bacterium]
MEHEQLKGREYIVAFVQRVSTKSGVYRMIGADDAVLYVGKAKNLSNRIRNYTSTSGLSNRIMRMVALTVRMEVIETRNEAEALLLEATLIKKYQPRYNILLKDDKSYPYICLTNHEFPRIVKHRGAQARDETYFGPFASAQAVDETITLLQKAFLLRPCSDTIFQHRTRPCLQYQIKRCSAPCVNIINKQDYASLIRQASQFLRGKNREVQEQLTQEMQVHAENYEYERASVCRDRIRILTQIQEQQQMVQSTLEEADVIACHHESGQACVQIWFFRAGMHFGNHAYFPAQFSDQTPEELITAFMGQYYQTHPIPKLILLDRTPKDVEVLQDALSMNAQRKVELSVPQRGERKRVVEALQNQAQTALQLRLAQRTSELKHLEAVRDVFGLKITPKRIEVYDNSHISGTHAVGGMIVSGEQGFEKSQYRRFTIRLEELTAGDDYAMLKQVLTRRLSRLRKEDPDRSLGMWADLLLIDGGKGHMSTTAEVLATLGIENLPFVCIAKGVDRNAGREHFFMPDREPFQLPVNNPTLHYLQRLRDEVHRFAISSHRIKRANAMQHSVLDDIPNIGSARKKALMLHFGSSKAVAEASYEALCKVEGINARIAQQIYDFFHE